MKLKGSTLIETVLAMAILLTVIGIALNSMVLSASASSAEVNTKVNLQMDILLQQSITDRSYKTVEQEIDGINYRQEFSFVDQYAHVVKLEITAERREEIIGERIRFIKSE